MNHFKKKLTAFGAMLTFLSLSGAVTYAASVSDVIDNTSNVGFETSDKRLDVNITSGKHGDVGQVDWGKFNVGKDERVNFGFSGMSQTIINRVLGGDLSKIYGKLTNSCVGGGTCDSFVSTSKVILINPAGMLFGAGSQVDLNSFTSSTFDFKGAKNLKGLTNAQQEAYINSLRNGTQKAYTFKRPDGTTQTVDAYTYNRDLNFDSNYTEAFKEAGLTNADALIKNSRIDINGATFDHFNSDFTGSAALNTNKSLNFVSNNIGYKDSLIRVGSNYNYNNNSSYGNVRLVTADGVSFEYLSNGYSDYYQVANDTKTDVTRNITMDNSGLAKGETAIESGNIHIKNISNDPNSNIKISNTIVKGVKMINRENGDILIVGSNDIDVDNTRLMTVNSSKTVNGTTLNTRGQKGGEVSIQAGKSATVKDSLILTSGTNNPDLANAGRVTIIGNNDDVNIENTDIISSGNVILAANKKVNLDNVWVDATNDINKTMGRSITISGGSGVDSNSSIIRATNDIFVQSIDENNKLTGDINFSGNNTSDGNDSVLIAKSKLSIQGANTKLDNTTVAYETIKFYNDGTTGTNNVTIANNSTFSPFTSTGSIGGDVELETNGKFTLDNVTMQKAAYKATYDRVNPSDDTSDLIDSGEIKGITHHFKTTATANLTNLKVTSTEDDVVVKNNSNINVKNDASFISNTKDVQVLNSTINAGNDTNILANNNVKTSNSKVKGNNNVNITAKTGSVNMVNASGATAGKDTNITAYNTIKFGNDGDSTINIEKGTSIVGGNNVNITSTNGNIEGEKTTMPTITYGNRLKFDAKNDNIFTSADSLKSVNVDYIAGNANRFYVTDDIQFVDSSLEAPTNFIESGSDVILNNLEIKKATTNAEDTVTKIFANGDITTKDVTGTYANDQAQTPHTFPQSVNYNRQVTLDKVTSGDTVLNINQTKLIATAETVKDANLPDKGSITLNLKNANNEKAGVELIAQNVDALDNDPTGGLFKPGYYLSGTKKWDKNIDKNEGPEIHVNAQDGTLSVSKIITDKLTLNKNNSFIASETVLTAEEKEGLPADTPSKGYIEVRDQGGFNLDDSEDYTNTPDGFGYDKHYVSTDKIIDQDIQDNDVTNKVVGETDKKVEVTITEGTPTVDVKVTYNENGDKITTTTTTTPRTETTTTDTDTPVTTTTDTYRTTTTTTKTTDKKHTIKFDNQGNEEEFILVYDKSNIDTKTEGPTLINTTTSVEHITTHDVVSKDIGPKVEVKVETEPCPTPPVVDREDHSIEFVRLPREQVEVSKTSKVADNTVDQTSNIMSAAAKIDISDEAEAQGSDDEKDFED